MGRQRYQTLIPLVAAFISNTITSQRSRLTSTPITAITFNISRKVNMFKKGLLGVLFVGLIAVLVYGAINRTMDKTDDIVEASERGRGRENTQAADTTYKESATSQVRYGGQGRGQQDSQSEEGRRGETTRAYPNYQEAPADWQTLEGVVTQPPSPGVDMLVETSDGEAMVGVGPVDLVELGLTLQAGDQVQIEGYWEGNEFKAAQLTQLSTGDMVQLRDNLGRPSWSGGYQGDSSQGGDQGRSGQGNRGSKSAGSADTFGEGQAQVDAWITIQGVVVNLDENELIVDGDGELITVANRPWWFAQEQGFNATPDDTVTLTGFYEDDAFEVGKITNNTTNESVLIRQENGRPLWAGPQQG
jgi:hypothetical protein